MYYPNPVLPWRPAPFIRLLLPFVAGILIGWYLSVNIFVIAVCFAVSTAGWLVFSFVRLKERFRLQILQGICLNLVLIFFGMMLTWQQDIRHHKNWFGNFYKQGDMVVARINEPLLEKAKSYKADAIVKCLLRNDSLIQCDGKILLYFPKDSAAQQLKYGDVIIINKVLQPIINSGNPGAFNYQRYAGFQQVFHNAFIKAKDWQRTNVYEPNFTRQVIFKARDHVLEVLDKYIEKDKNELSIAQALLIGYTNNLDKDLVQAYSNTGVVHIIAISGMHLGLIYALLVYIFKRLPIIKRKKLLQVVLILFCLWFFSFLTGGSASVIRAAVIFTFITIGKNFGKNSSTYNSLAASAFVMLCYNPYYLWDVGFQLSYLAVLGIIAFNKPLADLIYVPNKWLDKAWQLVTVSLAAQTLTFPVCIYYFHQFPNLFLLTNIIAVPLSTVILFAEIGLVAIASFEVLATYLGKLVSLFIGWMNDIVLWVNRFSFSVWDGIHATIFSTIILYILVLTTATWLLRKQALYLKLALGSGIILLCLYNTSQWQLKQQQKLVVYNVPQHQAIDFIQANEYFFKGDSILLEDGMLQNFHLKPGRISMQLNRRVDSISALYNAGMFYKFNHIKMAVVDNAFKADSSSKIEMDLVVISHNPKIKIKDLANIFSCNQYVFDASNSLWKIEQWQKECEELHLRSHSVPSVGAFVLDAY